MESNVESLWIHCLQKHLEFDTDLLQTTDGKVCMLEFLVLGFFVGRRQ
jgi:hypothetical protein